ncbi:MAG: FAD-binding oxidoreductase, partial [Acutalibacteraceae bacterium]|nr:FAD-binding oxidoreductase [Acutalibacteraceae bacterium]
MNESVWQKNANLPQFSELKGDIKTDVLIIGGGLAGILTAFFLKEAGIDYILVEKERICGGTTKNTTGKITFQHSFIYDKMISSLGTERAKMYLEANLNAALKYRELAKEL